MENIQSQFKLLKHIDKVNKWLNTGSVYPILANFNITNKCNNKCPLCTSTKKNEATVTYKKAQQVILQLKEVGVKAFGLGGGGDPACNPDFNKIIKFIHSNNMETGVSTNGYEMSEELISEIVYGSTWIRVSLDADGPEIYRKTHGMDKGSFEQVVNNIEKLTKKQSEINSDIVIGVTYLLGPHTVKGIYNAAKLAKNIGVNHIRFRPFFTYDRKMFNEKTQSQMFQELEKAQELSDEKFYVSYPDDRCRAVAKNYIRKYSKCFVHNFVAFITPELNLYPCCLLEYRDEYMLGSLKNKSFKQVWNSSNRKSKVSKIDISKCPNPCMLEKHNELLWLIKEKQVQHSNFL